jgi:hypothetical protein
MINLFPKVFRIQDHRKNDSKVGRKSLRISSMVSGRFSVGRKEVCPFYGTTLLGLSMPTGQSLTHGYKIHRPNIKEIRQRLTLSRGRRMVPRSLALHHPEEGVFSWVLP